MPTFADLRPLTADLPPLVLLSSLDFGGAGSAASRLLEGLIAAGADARMICLQKKSNLPQVGELKHPQTGQPLWNYDCALRQEVMRSYPNPPAGLEMFSLTKSLVNLADFDVVKNAPLIHLHWVAGLVGFPQAREVLRNKPVVWTARDMNPFTGGCHYSAGCEKWKTDGCQSCPQLGATTVDYDLAAGNFVNKYDGYQGLNLNIVTISRQFEQLVGESLLLKNYPRVVIHNGYSAETFAAPPRENARAAFKFPRDKKIILFVANDVKRRNKGFYLLVAALDRLRKTWAENPPLLVVVGMPPKEMLPQGYDCCLFGKIDDKQKMTAIYAAADVFVSSSLQEAFGNVTAEAQAAGTPGIVFADTGGADTVIDGVTGFVAKHPGLPLADAPMATQEESVSDLAAKIKQVLSMPAADYEKMRENCRQNARAEFCLELQVERHLRLYRKLLGLPETPTARTTVPVAPPAPQPAAAPVADYDYISPELKSINLDTAFPNLIIGDKNVSQWQWSRKNIPHHHYVDRRIPDCGFLDRDEAILLYNSALPFAGQPALEIGCFMGWSACHLASAGVILDVVDPLLKRDLFAQSVTSSLTAAGVRERVNLVPGFSPQEVERLALAGKRWKFIFIDGNHEAPGPLQDAQVSEKYAADDALIMFHDVNAPAVAAGVDYFRQRGWSIKIYHTTQIMAAAWRGKITAPAHTPDPKIKWEIPAHLQFLAAYFESVESQDVAITGTLNAGGGTVNGGKIRRTPLETNAQTLARFYADEIAKIIAAAKQYEMAWRENLPIPAPREELTDFYLQSTSFDRSGNVLIKTVNGQKTYYRGIVADKAEDFRQLYHCGVLTAIADAGRLVRVKLTNYYTEDFPLIFELETLRIVSSAYWSFSMLREAAVNMLVINAVLKHYGYGVWDGHCANTTFMRNRPVFFDVGSLVKGGSRSFFNEVFSYALIPLMMLATGKSHFARSAAYYVAPRILPASIGRKESAEIQTLFSMFMQHHARHSADAYNTILREVFQQGIIKPEYIDFLFPYCSTTKTAWGDYHDKAYAQIAPDKRYIRILELIKQFSPDAQTCVDIAGNAGYVAYLLAETGQFSSIINLDYDENAVESGRGKIKSDTVDFYLTNAMAADGNMPLADFTASVRSDLVLALAVTHHLLLTQCYNIHAVLARISMYTRKYAYVEFCPLGMYNSEFHKDNPPPVPPWYNDNWFEQNFKKAFKVIHKEVVARAVIAGVERDHRILYIGEKIERS
ncbi:MAG: glycosyltransferase [Planctomycetota bacterium]|jgi:glycosyltransferase involved in cell wall biosynthesis/predicted O-methyltransferase YrrM|nr:glycosyltransferase [Planctomycetota bacterium]